MAEKKNPALVNTHNNLVKMYKGLKARGDQAMADKVGQNLVNVRKELGLAVPTKTPNRK